MMKKLINCSLSIFIVVFWNSYGFAQIQKIYAPNVDSSLYFGSYVGIDRGKIIATGDFGLYESKSYGSERLYFFSKNGKEWQYLESKYKRKTGFNSSVNGDFTTRMDNGYLISVNVADNQYISDTLFLLKEQNGDFVVQLEILIGTHQRTKVSGLCLHKDWFMYRKRNFQSDTILYKDYFYRLLDEKWILKDSFSFLGDDMSGGLPNTEKYHMTDRFLVIGDMTYYDNGYENGKVEVYKKENGHFKPFQLIRHPEILIKGGFFGVSTEISDDNQFLFVGAFYSIDKIPKVYVYKLVDDEFVLYQKLTEPEAIGGVAYGNSMSLENGVLLVSGYGFYKAGMIFQYEFDGVKWVRKAKIQPQNNTDFDLFGVSIDQEGETVVVGASYDATYHEANGAAYIFQIPARDTLNVTICEGESYTFNDTVIYDSGHYTDTLLASYGVDSVVQLYLTVYPKDRIEIDTVLCDEQQLIIGDSVLTEEGIYTITLQNQYGCDSIVIAKIEYDYQPEVTDSITADYGCQNGEIKLSVEGNNPPYAFDWSGGQTGEYLSGLFYGKYNVTITSHSGCEYDYEYEVGDSIAYLIPNAFFPSGQEEINKEFRPYLAKDVHIISTEIYDRWGEKVFYGGEDEMWDGTYKGMMQSPGVYLYKILIDSPCGEEVKTGQVVLLR